jgi:hypothetical protein
MEPKEFIGRSAGELLPNPNLTINWVNETEKTVSANLEKQRSWYIREIGTRLLAVRIPLLEQDSYWRFPPNETQRNALRDRLLGQGWHHVDVDEGGQFVDLAVMRRPVVVVLQDGSSFDAKYQPDVEPEHYAEQLASHGAWRYVAGGVEFVPPHQIVAVRLESLKRGAEIEE